MASVKPTFEDIENLLEGAQRDAELANREEQQKDSAKARLDRHLHNGHDTEARDGSRGASIDRGGDSHMKDSDRHSANGSERSRAHRSGSEGDRRSARTERVGGSSRGHDGHRSRGDRSHRDSGDSYRRSGRDRSRSPATDHYRPQGRRDERDRDYGRDRRGERRDDTYSRDGPRRRDTSRDHRPYRSEYRDRRDDRRGGRTDDRGRDREEDKDAKAKEPELNDEEHDKRTVFVQQLAARLRTSQISDFFSQVGPVESVHVVKDRVSGRSKGVGYVEFKELESVEKAIGLTGQKLMGIPVIVSLTEAEKNRQARTNEGMTAQGTGAPFHRLYVGNIHFSVTEEDLTDVFSPFGELEFVQLQKEEQGRSKGYGFVQYTNPDDAQNALADMNGFEIAGRPIRVGLGNDKFTPETTANLLQRFQGQSQQFQGSQFSGSGGRGAHAGGNTNFDRATGREDKGANGSSALDDSDVGGVNFNNFSRESLMKKLARTEDAPPPRAGAGRARTDTKKPVLPKVAPSRCIVVKNAYNEAEETEPNWEKELEEDFQEECNDKYGPVAFVGLYRDSNEGEIYVKFKDVKGGDNALKGLNGRYFGGRTLTAQPVVDAIFNMNFPKAANV